MIYIEMEAEKEIWPHQHATIERPYRKELYKSNGNSKKVQNMRKTLRRSSKETSFQNVP